MKKITLVLVMLAALTIHSNSNSQIIYNNDVCDLPQYEDWSTGTGANPCACKWLDPATGTLLCSYGNCSSYEYYECLSKDCAGAVPIAPAGWFQGGGDKGFELCMTILPVELTTFEGTSTPNHIELYWETASETNSDYFTIEYSADGLHFDSLEYIDAVGNTTTSQSYMFRHYRVSDGVHYYRLKQVDTDGYSTTTTIISVDHREGFRNVIFSKVYPNPSTEFAYVKYMGDSPSVPIEMSIFNSAGILVETVLVENTISSPEIKLSLNNYQRGLYYIQIQQGSIIEIKNFSIN